MNEDYPLDPPAINGSPAHAFASHRTRASAIARHYALAHPLDFLGATADENNTIRLIAHLQAASDDPDFAVLGQEPSRTLAPKVLRSLNKGHGVVGTTVEEEEGTFLGFGYHVKPRPGDYDSALKELIVIAYRYRPLLSDDDFNFILDSLVPSFTVGTDISTFEKITINIQVNVPIPTMTPDFPKDGPETENHMLLIGSTMYLGNQLFFDRTREEKYNNRGLAKWLLGYMQTIAKHDFLEFNARPYQRYSLHALLNLHEFARDPEIRTAAQILLDYTMVKFAISSNWQRRIGPFRRLKQYTNRADNPHNELLAAKGEGDDAVIGFFLMYAGPTDINGNPTNHFPAGWGMQALMAGLAAYRPPPAAYILAMRRDIPAFQHRFYHGARPQLPASSDQADGGVEIYYRTPSFLLTAGGMFLNSGYGHDEFTKRKQIAIAQSITLLPTRAADVKFADLIRFDPYPDERRATNTAVHLGFACGANLRPSEKKSFDDTTTHAPAVSSHNGQLVLSWKGSGNQNLNAANVYTTEGLVMDGIEGLREKNTLQDTSEQGPAFASHAGRLFLAWKGAGNDNLNLAFSDDNGRTFRGNRTFDDTSHHSPALASHHGRLFLAWTGRGDGKLNVAKVALFANTAGGFGIEGLEEKVVLGDTSEQAPALASHNDRLFLAWKGSGNDNLNLMFSNDSGATFQGNRTFDDTSHHAPALASHNGRFFLAWTGRGDGNLNVARVTLFANTAGGFGIEGLEAKAVLGDTSDQAPALASHNGRLFLAWKGAGNDNLNLISSRDGVFQSGPWIFIDHSGLGFYVAAYRTPPAQPDALDTPLENLGLFYAMEASINGVPTMSFEDFERHTLERNTTLPAKFEYGGHYTFHTADDHRFSFWLHPSLEKYQARIVRMDEVHPVVDFTSLPLVDGPYLKARGHDGFFEVRHPECLEAPLVLDFSDPQNPDRVDNALACPKPLLDRALALVEVANQLLALSSQLVGAGRHAEAVAPAQAAVDVLQQIEPQPATEAHQSLLAEALLVLVIRLIAAGRADETRGPAEEAVTAYRRAAGATGADVGSLANQLLALSSQLVGAGRHAEAVAPAQAAVDVLQQIEPQPATEAHQSLLAEALLVLVIRLIAAGRADETRGPAEEAVTAYRRAAGATGADVGSLANQLLALSSQLVGAGRHAEAVAPAQAAVDVLQQIEPQPATEAHQSLLAEALLVLVIRLIAAGRADETRGPAEEAVTAYRRAAGATGADVGSLANQLLALSSQLVGAGRHAEAVAPAQAAVDVLRDFEPLPEAQAAYRALFAGALHALAVRLIDAQRPEDALQPAVEALEAYRRLAEDDPNAFQSQLAALEQLVAFLSQS